MAVERRDDLNSFLQFPSESFRANVEVNKPNYAVRAAMFDAWRRLVSAWRPMLVDPNDRGMAEKRLSYGMRQPYVFHLRLPHMS